MASELVTERDGEALVLTLSGPATRNSLSLQTIDAAIEALDVADADSGLRAVVVTGAGGHFCAGGDLRALRRPGASAADDLNTSEQAALVDRFHVLIDALRTFPKPVIAAVEGHAAGGGFSLALACDLIVAARDAQFHTSYARVGLSPDGGATWHLMQMLPRTLATQLLWTGEPVGAERLHALGLINEVVDPGQSLGGALRWARQLAERSASALASIKELLGSWPQGSLQDQLRLERTHFVANLGRADTQAALQAFFAARATRSA